TEELKTTLTSALDFGGCGSWLNGPRGFSLSCSFTLREIFTSLYFDLARIFAYLFQTTYAVGWVRDNAAINGRDGPEDTWGFGQILLLLLLALPFFSFMETVYGKCMSTYLFMRFILFPRIGRRALLYTANVGLKRAPRISNLAL